MRALAVLLAAFGFVPSATSGSILGNGRSILNPGWSPDGKSIAWRQVVHGAESRIWVASSNASHARPITGQVDALGQLAWLTNHKLIYWANFRLFTLKPGGRSSLFWQSGGDGFSLDTRAKRVATGSPACPICTGPVHVKTIATGSVRAVGGTKAQNGSPSLSPAGTQVAFERVLCPQAGECARAAGIWIASVASGAMKQLTTSGTCPSWSHDGREIAYVEFSDSTLRVVPAAGGSAMVLLHDAFCNTSFLPAWAPRSRDIAAVTGDGRLAVVDAKSGRTIAATGAGIGSVDGFAWSPDSAKLLVTARPITQGSCSSLWLFTVKSGATRLLRRC